MGWLVKGLLQKVCRNSAGILRKFAKKYVLLRQEMVWKVFGKFTEIARKFAEKILQ